MTKWVYFEVNREIDLSKSSLCLALKTRNPANEVEG